MNRQLALASLALVAIMFTTGITILSCSLAALAVQDARLKPAVMSCDILAHEEVSK